MMSHPCSNKSIVQGVDLNFGSENHAVQGVDLKPCCTGAGSRPWIGESTRGGSEVTQFKSHHNVLISILISPNQSTPLSQITQTWMLHTHSLQDDRWRPDTWLMDCHYCYTTPLIRTSHSTQPSPPHLGQTTSLSYTKRYSMLYM